VFSFTRLLAQVLLSKTMIKINISVHPSDRRPKGSAMHLKDKERAAYDLGIDHCATPSAPTPILRVRARFSCQVVLGFVAECGGRENNVSCVELSYGFVEFLTILH
jgi:hypothetical protein